MCVVSVHVGMWMCRGCRCMGVSWVQERGCVVSVGACVMGAGACVEVEVQVRGCVVGAGAWVCSECRCVCVHVLYVQVCIMCVHVCRARLTFNCSANSSGCLANP